MWPIQKSQPPAPLAAADHEQVLNLFQRSPVQHLHLDWRHLDEWLLNPDLRCWVVRENNVVKSLLGATLHPTGIGQTASVSWLRLALPARSHTFDPALDPLWEALRDDLGTLGIRQVAVLAVDSWVETLTRRWKFRRTNAVITLRRHNGEMPPSPSAPYQIRDVGDFDLDDVARVDAAAFAPLWQYCRDELRAALYQAVTFTVLQCEGQTLGYQLSTGYVSSGHLARLAVAPEMQGHGLGGMLVGEMIRFFQARNIDTVTVNTQEDNLYSQRLYRRLGFKMTGYRVPVWTVNI